MPGEEDLTRLLAGMDAVLHRDRYVFVTVPGSASGSPSESTSRLPSALTPVATVREDEGVSAVVTADDADAHGLRGAFPCAGITLRVHSALEAVGLLAVITRALADAGIATNPVAGFHHDHLFVPWDRRHDAMAVLGDLAREGGRRR